MLVSAPSLASSQPLACGQERVAVMALRLNNFRNYIELDVTTSSGGDSGAVVLYGPNGAGKTNIMEAVSLLAPGRGLRRAKAEMLAHNPQKTPHKTPQKTWSVSAEVITPDGLVKCGTGTIKQDAPKKDNDESTRRVVKVNGEFAPQSALAELFAVSWLTPDMDDVLAASPSERRRFLDRLVIAFDGAHAGRLQRYEKLHRERHRLMDEGQNDEGWYQALEAQMAQSGVAIIAGRQALVEALDQEAQMPIPAFPSARLWLEGEAEDWLKTMPAVEVEDRLCELARECRHQHQGQGIMPGPMNSLLQVCVEQTGVLAQMSSTGEQKALLISVVLAHARLQGKRLKRPPILLLDDIAAHLDESRRRALFELTADLYGQVWFSGTDVSLFSDITHSADVFRIENANLTRQP